MKAQDIVDELSKTIPLHTTAFSTSLGIVSIVLDVEEEKEAGNTATVTTVSPHGLVEGQNVAITGVQNPVEIDKPTFLRTMSTATFETLQEHDLTLSERDKASGGKSITISGATEAEFNGTFLLLGVPNRNKLIIAVDDSGPTTISGSPLVDNGGVSIYNGLFPATNITTDTFEYPELIPAVVDPVVTGAEVQTSIRIISVLDIEQYLQDVYTRKELDDDVLVVQLGDVTQSKKRNEETDAATSSAREDSYTPTLIQPFAIYIVQNVCDDLTGTKARDRVECEFVPAIFSSVLRAQFDTGFTYSTFRSTFTGHGVFAYSDINGKNKAIYAHEVAFEQLVQITRVDTVEPRQDVAMRDVSYTLTTDLGTGELTANVNLDDDAEPEL